MKIVVIKKEEMIIRKKIYIDMVKQIEKLKEQASPFYKYSINEIRQYCGFAKIKNNSEILEEEKKIPENNFNYIYSCGDEHIMANFENIKTTLKDIIDYLKSKGE